MAKEKTGRQVRDNRYWLIYNHVKAKHTGNNIPTEEQWTNEKIHAVAGALWRRSA